MDVWIWAIVAAVVAFVLLRTVGRRAVVGRVDPTDLSLEPELVNEVRALARAGRKTEAIKMLRDGAPGLGIGPAKVMVDRMATPTKPPPPPGEHPS